MAPVLPLAFRASISALRRRDLGLRLLQHLRHVFVLLGLQKSLEGLLDAEQPQVGPHQFIELAQARVGGRHPAN